MRLVFIPNSRRSNSIDVQLEHANMVFDPRIIRGFMRGYTFRFSVKGRILTITSTDEDRGWGAYFYLRAYLPTEVIPYFTSTVYNYWGLLREIAPEDVTEVIFHPSSFIRPFTPSRNMLSMVVNPWCGSRYPTPSHGLIIVLSLNVIP